MSEGTAAADFAALLGELKERSGLSYGVLAKRLHMSTSTLHRYCNGDAVPADYAPVERLARLCKASPEELVQLHRRWVLADAGRGRKGGGDSPEVPVAPGAGAPAPEAGSATQAPAEAGVPEASEEGVPGEAVVRRTRRPRPALLVGIAAAVVLGGVGLAVAVPSGGADGDGRGGSAAVSDSGRRADGGAAASVSPSGSSAAGKGRGPGKETTRARERTPPPRRLPHAPLLPAPTAAAPVVAPPPPPAPLP